MKHNYSTTPSVRYNRSKQDLSHGVKTTMNVGTLYPIDIQEVLPGDSVKCNLSAVARITSSFLKPVMDNAYMDIYHFFVPLRLLDNSLEGVFGDPNPSAYVQYDLKSIPGIVGTVGAKTVADYLGLPVGAKFQFRSFDDVLPSLYPFRAFATIYNQWFRNENVISETYVNKNNSRGNNEVLNANAWSATNYCGLPPKVSKRADYFTNCLPKPQKGDSVYVPMTGSAPVIAANEMHYMVNQLKLGDDATGAPDYPLLLKSSNGSYNISMGQIEGSFPISERNVDSSNLVADLSQTTSASINDWRYAFALQRMLEKDALYGSRYNEYIYGHFGVSSPDSRLQFSEYLGGGRISLNVQQVAQTSEGTTESPLANLGGYSLTNGYSKFIKGFTEHGYVITVACIRTLHTYQQGIDKLWFRKNREDFYDPTFANIGNQPVYSSQLFNEKNTNIFDLKTSIFGYQEAWAEYRHLPSKITGQLRSGVTDSLDYWHFADYFADTPILSQAFVEETPVNFDRTITVESTVEDQFICDFWFKESAIRVMPVYSVPGLIDHH